MNIYRNDRVHHSSTICWALGNLFLYPKLGTKKKNPPPKTITWRAGKSPNIDSFMIGIFQPAIRFRGTLIPGSPFLWELTLWLLALVVVVRYITQRQINGKYPRWTYNIHQKCPLTKLSSIFLGGPKHGNSPFFFVNFFQFFLSLCEPFGLNHLDVVNFKSTKFHITGKFYGERFGHKATKKRLLYVSLFLEDSLPFKTTFVFSTQRHFSPQKKISPRWFKPCPNFICPFHPRSLEVT